MYTNTDKIVLPRYTKTIEYSTTRTWYGIAKTTTSTVIKQK